jgi:hypothetical protein
MPTPLFTLDGDLTPYGLEQHLKWLDRERARTAPQRAARAARAIRQRMIREIERAASFDGAVTRDGLRRAGFTAAQIDAHFEDALRASEAERMVA